MEPLCTLLLVDCYLTCFHLDPGFPKEVGSATPAAVLVQYGVAGSIYEHGVVEALDSLLQGVGGVYLGLLMD